MCSYFIYIFKNKKIERTVQWHLYTNQLESIIVNFLPYLFYLITYTAGSIFYFLYPPPIVEALKTNRISLLKTLH